MLKNILKRELSNSQSRYLISRRYGLFVYLLILNKKDTYMADLEKTFVEFGSRSTMVKVIKELISRFFNRILSPNLFHEWEISIVLFNMVNMFDCVVS